MDISIPAALLVVLIIWLVVDLWNLYKEDREIRRIVSNGVRIAQALKADGHFGELEGKGRKAAEAAEVYVLEQAHALGVKIDRAKVERLVKDIYHLSYGGKK